MTQLINGSRRAIGTTGKISAMLAGGAALGAAGHAGAQVVTQSIDTVINTATSTTSVTVDQPVIGNGLDNDPIFTFSVSTTNGLTVAKPSVSGAATEPVVTTTGATGAPVVAYTAGSPIATYSSSDYSLTGTALPLLSANGTSGQFTEAGGLEYLGFDAGPNRPPSAPDYYGWVGIEPLATLADGGGNVSAEITEIAIDTTANQVLLAGETVPEPTSLSLLALGLAGLAAYRRRA